MTINCIFVPINISLHFCLDTKTKQKSQGYTYFSQKYYGRLTEIDWTRVHRKLNHFSTYEKPRKGKSITSFPSNKIDF